MASDVIAEMELYREHWEDTLLGFDFWKDAFEWCAEVDAREQVERLTGKLVRWLFIIHRYTSLSNLIAFSPNNHGSTRATPINSITCHLLRI
jgi:hypothetical protein